jgi:hypothetical protein
VAANGIVNLPEDEYKCTDFNEYQSACSHAMTAVKFKDIDSIAILDDHCSTIVYKQPIPSLTLASMRT